MFHYTLQVKVHSAASLLCALNYGLTSYRLWQCQVLKVSPWHGFVDGLLGNWDE